MSLPDGYLDYPRRRYGMDHERYDWSQLSARAPVTWPRGGKLALWVNVALQFFPLDQRGKPFKVPGGMTMPYPDLRHFTLRDYGNRVGIYRVLAALDARGIRPSVAINSQLALRYPALLDQVLARNCELLCHGWNMDTLHYGGMAADAEEAQIVRALDTLRERSGQAVEGWLSPARSESENTPDLLARHGVRWFCDWVNDDMPYRFRTRHGELWAMPLSNELEDQFILVNNGHSEDSYREQVQDAGELLLAETASQGGRILALNIHPWLLGQPHRIAYLERALDHLLALDGVFSATPRELLPHCAPRAE